MSCEPAPIWLDAAGPEADLVISTRVRLARNLADCQFGTRSTAVEREEIRRRVEAAAAQVPALAAGRWHRIETLGRSGRQWLHERQQSSRELVGLTGPTATVPAGAAVLVLDGAAMMVNEEDHLRFQALVPGFAPPTAYRIAAAMDQGLGAQISFAFHPRFGYLTSCHTNVGTGLRASVLIHLPTLVWTREIGRILHGLGQVGVTCRGFWGEDTEVVGDLFQLSNQVTLGRSEVDLLAHLERLVGEVIGHERRARLAVWERSRRECEDRVWRAWGLLQHARLLGFRELAGLLGEVRLGVCLNVLPSLPLATLNQLLVLGQDAHVARWAETDLDDDALPAYRADLVHDMLAQGDRA